MATKQKVKLTPAQQYNKDFAKRVEYLAKNRKGAFTVDDVIAKVGSPPQGGKALGPLMNAAAYRLDLIVVGAERSKQPSRRGAMNKSWKSANGFKKFS